MIGKRVWQGGEAWSLLTVLVVLSFSSSACGQSPTQNMPTFSTSMVDLISDPVRSEGRRIAVVGYLDSGINTFLYLSDAHAKFNDSASAVVLKGVAPEVEQCGGQYVRVVGEFGQNSDHVLYLRVHAVYLFDEETSLTKLCWSRDR